MSLDQDGSLPQLPAGIEGLQGARVRLVPAGDEHLVAFTALFSDPSVRRWWPAPDPVAEARDHVSPEAHRAVWAIEVEGEIVGLIQAWEETEPDYRRAGIDLSLLGSAQGQGLGPDAIRTVARWLFEVREATTGSRSIPARRTTVRSGPTPRSGSARSA